MGHEIYATLGKNPPPMESGYQSLSPGSQFEAWKLIREAADGTVANALTLNDFQVPEGLIDISRVPIISLGMTFVKGSLTNADIIPYFIDDNVNGNFNAAMGSAAIAAGVVTLTELKFRLTADGSFIVAIPNPGCKYMWIYTASSGTITGSSLIIAVGGGWGSAKSPGL